MVTLINKKTKNMLAEGLLLMETRQATISVHKPDIKEKLFFLSAGLLMSVPFTLFFSDLSNRLCVSIPMLFAEVCSIVIFTPFIEEVAKVFPLFYRHGETERSLVDLGILTGIGFGLTEFAIYVFTFNVSPLARISGVIFHASSTCITAYGVAKKKPLTFYLIAVASHLVYNLFALLSDSTPFLYIPAAIVLVGTYLLAWRLYHQTEEIIVL